MTWSESIRPLIDNIRSIPGANLDVRPIRVYISRRTTDKPGFVGHRFEDETEITVGGGRPPRVKQLDDEQMAVSSYSATTYRIGPFTPPFTRADDTTGGVDLASLMGDAEDNEQIVVRLVGGQYPGDGARFIVRRKEQDRPFSWFLTVERIGGV